MHSERRHHRARPALEPLETRAEPVADLSVDGSVTAAGIIDWRPLDADAAGILRAEATSTGSSGVGLRLMLATADGTILATSAGDTDNTLAASVELHLQPGSYLLGVSATQPGLAYHLETNHTAAVSPVEPLPNPGNPKGVAADDLNGDTFPDIVAINLNANTVSLWFGNGDGTFQPPRDLPLPANHQPLAVLVADVNADDRPDIITANSGRGGTLGLFLADDELTGSFLPRQDIALGGRPVALAAGDLDGDGRIDLATASRRDQNLSFLKGVGDGTFEASVQIPDSFEPSAVAIADVTGDGKADLAWTSFQDGFVRILPGTGGPFNPAGTRTSHKVGNGPVALLVADVSGDGRRDIITANNLAGTISLLTGTDEGGLTDSVAVAVGAAPVAVAAAFIDGDTTADLTVANRDDTMSVLLGAGEGTFDAPREMAVGSDQTAVAVADFNRDGLADLVSSNGAPGELRVSPGNGDGTFLTAGAFIVGRRPSSVALADLDGDRLPDAVSVGNLSDSIDVALGNGDGTFDTRRSFAVGRGPTSVTLADLNGDGRRDAATTSELDNTVSVLLGNGDGTFLPMGTYPVGKRPQAVVATDIDGDDIPDLVTADAEGNTLTVWWGKGDGTFENRLVLEVGVGPIAVAVADLDGDDRADLVSANEQTGSLSLIYADPAIPRLFQPKSDLLLGKGVLPVSVAVADLNNDRRLDLATGTKNGYIGVFLGNDDDDQPFRRMMTDVPGGNGPFGLVIADMNGDGQPDLASSDSVDGTAGVALGLGNGTFQNPFTVPVGRGAIFLATDDLNRDGRPDLVSSNSRESTLGVLLGPFDNADSPTASTPLSAAPPRHSPVLADLDGDGRADSITRDRTGAIYFRKGQADPKQPFAAARLLNDPLTRPARDIVAQNLGGGRMALASVDLTPDRDLSATAGRPVYRVVRHTIDGSGKISEETAFTTTLLPTGITAGNLDGSGRDALVLTHALEDRVTIALPGRFDSPIIRQTGDNPTDVLFTDVDGDQRADLLVSASASGDATLFRNDAGQAFADTARYPLGADWSGADDTGAVRSLRKPAGTALGDFFPGGGPDDLAVLLQGSHELAVLRNNDRGGFLNPNDQWATPTTHEDIISDLPGPLVSGNFNNDNITDVAFLERGLGEVWVWQGRGDGTFEFLQSLAAGVAPEGLTAFRVGNQTDLFVGNAFGDVLRLTGKSDGTFEAPPPLTGTQTSLSVRKVAGSTESQVLVVNQQSNAASIQTVTAKGKTQTEVTVAAPNAKTQQAPGAGTLADLNGGSLPDMIVVGTASNDVVIRRSLGPDANGKPTYAPAERYAVGTNPVAVLAQDINGDNVRDLLVTNRGSNDVSILFGSLASGNWTAVPGPRVSSGGLAPIGSTLRDQDHDGRPELIVTNSLSSPGAKGGSLVSMSDPGFGYFNDSAARVTPMPGIPIAPPLFPGAGVITTTDGNLIGLDAGTLQPFGTVFGGGGIREINTWGNGRLVAFRDGGVEVLAAGADGMFQSASELMPLTGIPSEPTALEVLETQSGFRALVAAAGSDQLFVFDLPVSQGPGIDGPGESPVVSQTTVLSPDSLAVVVTLLAGGLSEDGSREQPTREAGGPDDGNGPAEREGVQVAGEEEEAQNADAPPAEGDKPPPSADAERELEGTRLYRPTEETVEPKEKPPAKSKAEAAPPGVEELVLEVSERAEDEVGEEESVMTDEVSAEVVSSAREALTTVVWLTVLMAVLLRPSLAGGRRQPWQV